MDESNGSISLNGSAMRNSTVPGNGSSAEDPSQSNMPNVALGITILMCLMYTVITLVALLGNGLVCYIVLVFKRMRTVTNILIVNLAVGDILMATLCIPFTFVSNLLLEYWPFGAIMCPIVGYSQAVSVFSSAYTLVIISIDRYVAILYPLKPRLTDFSAYVCIGVVWLVALITPIPTAVTSGLVPHPRWINTSIERYICQENWSLPDQRYYYSIILMILQFFFPLVVLVFTYSRIAVAVWGKKTPVETADGRDKRIAKSKRKIIIMMIVVVSVFTACWLPFNILLTVGDQYPSVWRHPHIRYIWFILHWLAMSHTCYNPIIYCWLNVKFREGFVQLCSRYPCCAFRYGGYRDNLRRCGTVTTTYSSVKKAPGSTLKYKPGDMPVIRTGNKWHKNQSDVSLNRLSATFINYKQDKSFVEELDDGESQV